MLDKYLNQDIDNPEYLFHGSPLKLDKVIPHQSEDARGIENNIANAVFLFPSFMKSTAYAFKDTIKGLSKGMNWDFDIPNSNSYPLMTMWNVNVDDEIVGYIHVFKKEDDMVKDKDSYQYKCYHELVPLEVIPIKYKDYKKNYQIHEFNICVPTLEMLETKWDYEISINDKDKDNWVIWKDKALKNYEAGKSIPYYGVLDGDIIVEATAMVDASEVQNADRLVDDDTAYLTAFRTKSDFEGQGYFKKVFLFMIKDLKERGYKKVTLGVEPEEIRNMQIYEHLGFNEFIKSDIEEYPDGTKIDVNYYCKHL